MRRLLLSASVTATLLCADTVVLRSGREINGDYLGGTPRTVRMQVGERVETVDVDKIVEIRFGSAEPSSAQLTPSPAPRRERTPMTPARSNSPQDSPAPARRTSSSAATVPAGTAIAIRMIDDVDSTRDRVGQTFRASVDESVVVGEETVIPRGADVEVKLVDDKQAGRLSGRTELTLDLVSVKLNGRTVEVSTEEVTEASESRTGRTGKVVGGTAALGAIIGAIAGGGRGAAIGGLSGAAAGGAIQVITKGPTVKIPSETRLTFTLEQPLRP